MHPDKFYLPYNSNKIKWDFRKNYGILHNPHLSRNEQCLLRPYTESGSIYEEYFSHLKGIVMVAYKSFLPMALSGADFDGDLVKIVVDRIIVSAIEQGVYSESLSKNFLKHDSSTAIIKIPSPPASAKAFPPSVPFSNIQDTFSNQVGLISNLAVIATAYEYGSKKNDNYKNFCAKSTIVTGLEIDAAKTSKHPTANINELRTIVGDSESIFLNAKNGLSNLNDGNNHYSPQVRDDNGKLSMFLFKKSEDAVQGMSDIEIYDEQNLPPSMIDCLPGKYLQYLKKKQDSQAEETESFPRKRIHYCFQINQDWKKNLNPTQSKEVRKLVEAYIKIKKFARDMENTKKFSDPLDDLNQKFNDTQSVNEVRRSAYDEIAKIFLGKENSFELVNNSLQRLVDEKWYIAPIWLLFMLTAMKSNTMNKKRLNFLKSF